RDPLPVPMDEIDAVVLSHAHIDHSGRLPLLVKNGYTGPIYTHRATAALCEIMLSDSAYIHEKDAEWENKRRHRKGLPSIEPLFNRDDAEAAVSQFIGVGYEERKEILPKLSIRFSDAGHILGAAIVEIWISEGGVNRKLVFSGDLGYRDAPIMEDPSLISHADLVLMESTYGDRLHRSFADTLTELGEVFEQASRYKGNVIIPAFAVGRTQDLLYLLAEHYETWKLDGWRVFLDSPMAIRATDVYAQFRHLYGARLFRERSDMPQLGNFVATKTSEESMAVNRIDSGAVIIAGSGMCTGGRVLHHLKHNLWRSQCHVVIVGYQANGTLGRLLVDGADYVRLWGQTIRVNAKIHTIGGLSAHADQAGLLDWYAGFENRPPVCLVHGEPEAQHVLATRLREDHGADVSVPGLGETRQL
ncbi:MAG: MBL fold metallo-hydrolase, partial [Gammaproteobacteria bacterium]|nr:MBL fold metallo-hydrolase [Gammaproteobacteria bacterium]